MKRTIIMADLEPYAALFKDLVAWAPDLQPSLSRDFQRLETVVSSRGRSFLLLDLPEAGKAFDFSLSRGYFNRSGLPVTMGKTANGWSFFLGRLFERVFTSEGTIREPTDHNAVFFIRQVLYLAKKLNIDCPKQAVSLAVDEFERIEWECRTPTLHWDLDTLGSQNSNVSFLDGYRASPDLVSHRDTIPKPLLVTLERVSDIIISTMPVFDWRSIVPGHGPGAVADVKTGSDKYHFHTWSRKLDKTFPFEYFTQYREDLHLDHDEVLSPHEPPAQLCAVPKTYKGPRLITIEPVAHQYIQQGMLKWIRKNFPSPLHYSINFSRQDISGNAALAASKDGKSATIDLSSASDRLTCWLVERMFRKAPDFLDALHACRSRYMGFGTLPRSHAILLRKYAGQGNATTFPVQSIAYAIIAIASVLFEDGIRPSLKSCEKAAKQVRVFGDDIILPSRAVQNLVILLTHLGLKVNMAKSHMEGKFRESCGTDAYDGVNVTPVYIRSFSLGSQPIDLISWVDVSNNAYSAGLWSLADWMKNQIPEKFQGLIPISNRQLGCLTLASHQVCLVSSRWRRNVRLHRDEIRGLSVTGRAVRRQRGENIGLLQYFLEFPSPDFFGVYPRWTAGYNVRTRTQIRVRWVPSY